MSRTNETRHIKWHETCEYKCRLDASLCSNKQHWNDDKCRCECKGLIDKGVCHEGSIWSPSNCECKCDKSCDENCTCRKKLVDKPIEECTENVEEVKLANFQWNCIQLKIEISINAALAHCTLCYFQ